MEKISPLVSFVLPAFKAQFFQEAIESILNQTYSNFELLIVNDCSPDDLDGIVNSFNDDRIKYYVNEENIGGKNLVKNWNLCLSYAKGEFFVLASDDDVYEPDFLKELIDLSIKYPKVDVFHSRISIIDNNNNVTSISSPCFEYETCLEFMNQRVINRRLQVAPDFMVRRKALDEIGGFIDFPLAWYSDEATWYVLAKNNGVAYTNRVLFNWRHSGVNISSRIDNTKCKIIAARLYQKWMINFLTLFSPESVEELFFKNNINKFLSLAVNRQIGFDLVDSKFSVFLSIFFSKEGLALIPLKIYLKSFLFKLKGVLR